MFHHLGYRSFLVNCIIDKCDYSSTLDAKTKSDETLRVSIPFKGNEDPGYEGWFLTINNNKAYHGFRRHLDG